MSDEAPENYLQATEYLDYNHPLVAEFSDNYLGSTDNDQQRAVKLYYGVRDEIKYDPYLIRTRAETYTASYVLKQGAGYCIQKAAVYAACCRRVGIPARPGYSDVRNHIASKKLLDLLGTDIFVYHGYVEVWLNGRWVKTTPVFNLELCKKFHILPLEFDGQEDSLNHPFDAKGRKYMEYVCDHGTRNDVPVEEIIQIMLQTYPNYFKNIKQEAGNFYNEGPREGS